MMKIREASILVLKAHKFDKLLESWLFAKDKESMIKARNIFCSVRVCGGKTNTMNRIKQELADMQKKSFYTIYNTTTKVVSYHGIDEDKETLRDWMINHLDMSCDYETHKGYTTIEK